MTLAEYLGQIDPDRADLPVVVLENMRGNDYFDIEYREDGAYVRFLRT